MDIPAPLGKHEKVSDLEVRVEIAREKERARAEACAEALEMVQR